MLPSTAADLESVEEMELEEEEQEEDEEAACARRARRFALDPRVRFLGRCLQLLLRLPEEKWGEYLQSEEHRQVLEGFLESPGRLVFTVAATKSLEVSKEVRRGAGWRDHPSGVGAANN